MREAVWVVLDRLVLDTQAAQLVVAFSGGRDSLVLLHIAAGFARARGLRVSAAHVDHGLADASATWASTCQARAEALGIDCVVLRVVATPPPGVSLEAWARAERYALLEALCIERTLLLTAHHEDDQRETVLQRVLAGAGPHGLAGIPAFRRFGRGCLGRPLLSVSRAAITAYAQHYRLSAIEDPANADGRFLRNRLRHRLLPMLDELVPGGRAGLLRLGRIQHELARGLDALADALIERAGLPVWQLAEASLDAAGSELAPFVLRRALARAGIPRPGTHQLQEILGSLRRARPDAGPVVCWGGHAVRRYRDCLYFTAATLPAPPTLPLPWHGREALQLPWGRLRAVKGSSQAINPDCFERTDVTVAFRAGGERCRPVGRSNSQALKKLFQDWGVPPWERELIPLLYVDGQLAAVAGHCVCAPFAAPGDGVVLEWQMELYPDTRI
jgi:tRNA(Ile)-lysidine synthase